MRAFLNPLCALLQIICSVCFKTCVKTWNVLAINQSKRCKSRFTHSRKNAKLPDNRRESVYKPQTDSKSGIGLAFAQAYSKLGYKVYATARDASKAADLANIANVTVLPLDVADPASVKALGSKLANTPIDLLINNAGFLLRDEIETVKPSEMIKSFEINALGPLLVVQALLPNIKQSASARIVNITSRMGSVDDNDSGRYYSYRASKSALNMITKSLSIDMADFATTIVLHPGYIQTGMTNFQGDMKPEETVERMMKIIEGLTKDSNGKFFHRDGQELPW